MPTLADTWGVSFLVLQERGIQFADVALDGARGISFGIKQAGLTIPLCPDLFHLLRESSRLICRLESSAYMAIEQSLRVQKADKESKAPQRRIEPAQRRLGTTTGGTYQPDRS
ncbi:MAG: hypothetical protein QG641_2738 [Candidatus Poribacteria bacterium]|nr:hypothetical protein [Candidatus Poribacteria bacterium]MDQ1329448.1 hypothetical protein [Candidatus Poribacteria bacterium]